MHRVLVGFFPIESEQLVIALSPLPHAEEEAHAIRESVDLVATQ
jgi:hypothetical protein